MIAYIRHDAISKIATTFLVVAVCTYLAGKGDNARDETNHNNHVRSEQVSVSQLSVSAAQVQWADGRGWQVPFQQVFDNARFHQRLEPVSVQTLSYSL